MLAELRPSAVSVSLIPNESWFTITSSISEAVSLSRSSNVCVFDSRSFQIISDMPHFGVRKNSNKNGYAACKGHGIAN
jgi:hypothetical protein